MSNERYGFFYKSHGQWTGPYANKTTTLDSAKVKAPRLAKMLKSKVSIRKVS